MIAAWIALFAEEFPNRNLINRIRILFFYLFMALKNFGNSNSTEIPELQISSKIWTQYNKWLVFSIKYLNPRDWARSPVILAVSGSYKLAPENPTTLLNESQLNYVNLLCKNYSRAFNGITEIEFKNWLIRYTILMHVSIETSNTEPNIKTDLSMVEIGAGFAPALTLSSYNPNIKIYSYDCWEMQVIQKHIEMKVLTESSKIQFISTNISSRRYLPLPVPTEAYELYAFWSFTEIQIDERLKFLPIIKNSKKSIICCNQEFEGTNNFAYLEEISYTLKKKLEFKELSSVFSGMIPNYMSKHRIYTLTDEQIPL